MLKMQNEFFILRIWQTVRTVLSCLLVVTSLTLMILIIALW
ncbi:MAG: hypothetical protein WC047_01995 [Kiritimatiellales bacterium]